LRGSSGNILSDYFGEQFIIENRVGAGGNVGMQSALASPPDGYTVVFVGPNNAINATLYEKLPFDFLRDSVPIAGTMRLTNVMEVNLTVPANSVAEFIAYAKANPGKINFASGGVGTSPHLSGELFKAMTGVNIVHVPYRGSAPALTDLLAGQVRCCSTICGLDRTYPQRQGGRSATALKRVPAPPDVPTIAETSSRLRSAVWSALRPAGRPDGSTSSTTCEHDFGRRGCKGVSASLAGSPCPRRPMDSASWSPTKPKNGPKSSSSPAPSWTDTMSG
jgi:tripartite-type tricarboxylate transporter receptor subunit TctC